MQIFDEVIKTYLDCRKEMELTTYYIILNTFQTRPLVFLVSSLIYLAWCKSLPLQKVIITWRFLVIVWLWPATKGPRGCSAAPPPAGVQRRIERNRQKLVGRVKGSLTEQQTKGTITTTIQTRRIHKTKQQNAESNSHCPQAARRSQATTPSCTQLPPARAQHDGTWCGIPCSVWSVWVSPPGCVPSWLLRKN